MMRIWTVPNFLTVARLGLLYPIFVYLERQQPWMAVAFMLLGVVTDLSDGVIARKFNQQSDLGRLLDPAVDKINVLSVAVYLWLAPGYEYPLWFLAFLLLRELAVIVAGLLVMRGRKIVMESTRPGKLSAFFSGLSIPLYVLNWQPWALISVIVGLVLTLWSTTVYYRRFKEQMKPGPEAGSVTSREEKA